MMAHLKQGYDKPPRHTQQQQQQRQQTFTNIYTADVCECLRTRNLCKTSNEQIDDQNVRLEKARHKKKPLYSQNTIKRSCGEGSLKDTLQMNIWSFPAFYFEQTILPTLYGNLLQRLVGALIWHVTASTAISIIATIYYFIANTQGASAVLDETTVALTSPSSSSSSAASSSSSSSSSSPSSLLLSATYLSTTPSTNLSFLQTPYGYIYSSNHSNSSITLYNQNSSNNINNIYLDLNYKTNSTEITSLNGASSLPTNKVSGYSFDNNNNDNINDSYNNIATVFYNRDASFNETFDEMPDENASEYIFDRTDVRIIFITLYTMVFCCCFFGNLLVILVVTLSRRLRSITNFFLANLALADFCVGLFCVMQNLSIYLIDSWVFGEFLCRMYQFVHSLSYTASIFILVVICMERYFAIVHPITCKQILTAARLRMAIFTVWVTSAIYSTPKFVFSKTIKNVHTESGREEEICVLDRKMFNSKLLDMINFGLLYVIPLLVMMILYTKIAVALWRSSRGLQHHLAQQENGMGMHNSMYHHHHQRQYHNLNQNSEQEEPHPHAQPQHHHHHNHHLHNHHQQLSQEQQLLTAPLAKSISQNNSTVGAATLSRKQSCKYNAKRGVNVTESQVCLDDDRPVVSTCRKTSFYKHANNQQTQPTASTNHQRSHALHNSLQGGSQRVSHISHSSNNVLRARRGVVRMLIIFVLTFALCNLPYHARKMWQYWSRSYRGDSNFNALFTPLTFLVTYFNSGINPLLYAFLSRNFRKGMKELLMCSWRKSKTKSSTNSSMHHKRVTLQTSSMPTDVTHIGNEQL